MKILWHCPPRNRTSDSIKTCFCKLLICLEMSINYVQQQHLQNSGSMQAYDYFVSLLPRDGETFFSNTEWGTNFLSFKLSTFVVSLVKYSSTNLSSLFSSTLFWYGVYLSEMKPSRLYPMIPTTAATGSVTYGAYVRRKATITGSILPSIWNNEIHTSRKMSLFFVSSFNCQYSCCQSDPNYVDLFSPNNESNIYDFIFNINTHTITICTLIKSQCKRKMPVQRLTVQ